MEIDPSMAEEESDDNLTVGLADKAGQETAPITGLTSEIPLDGFFQAFLGLHALLFLSAFELSTADAAAAASELPESMDDEEEDDGGDGWLSGSESAPRTTLIHGEGKFFRG